MCLALITSTLNCESDLQLTFRSLSKQIKDLEQWIIIDAGSSDGTLSLAERIASEFENVAVYTLTGSSIYEAWNFALESVTADWVWFVGAGDEVENNVIGRIKTYLHKVPSGTDIAYGRLTYLNKTSRAEVEISEKLMTNEYKWGLPRIPPHPATFTRKPAILREGKFNEQFKIASDSELTIKILSASLPFYIDLKVDKMQLGGKSSHPMNLPQVTSEVRKIRSRLKIKIPATQQFSELLQVCIISILFKVFDETYVLKLIDTYRSVLGKKKKWT